MESGSPGEAMPLLLLLDEELLIVIGLLLVLRLRLELLIAALMLKLAMREEKLLRRIPQVASAGRLLVFN